MIGANALPTSTDLYVVLDINSRLLRNVKPQLSIIMANIKTMLGLHACSNVDNTFTLYGIDSFDVYQLYPAEQGIRVTNFDYSSEFKLVMSQLNKIIEQKGWDENWESKLVKCLSMIICKANKKRVLQLEGGRKQQELNIKTRITFITCERFQLSQNPFQDFLSLCIHCSKSNIRLDVIQMNLEKLPVDSKGKDKQETIGIDGLKLGVQLTQGVIHQLSNEQIKSKLFAQMLLSSFNPGEALQFYQPKISELQYQSFCCCGLTTQQQAFACSNCLGVNCMANKNKCSYCDCTLIL